MSLQQRVMSKDVYRECYLMQLGELMHCESEHVPTNIPRNIAARFLGIQGKNKGPWICKSVNETLVVNINKGHEVAREELINIKLKMLDVLGVATV